MVVGRDSTPGVRKTTFRQIFFTEAVSPSMIPPRRRSCGPATVFSENTRMSQSVQEKAAPSRASEDAVRRDSEQPSVVSASTPVKDESLQAMLLGLFAAVAYSVANLALRGLSKTDGGAGWDMWVAGNKALPTFIIAVVLIAIRRFQKQPTFASWNIVWPILVAALFNQLGGNFAFQMSLKSIGLAISVPICFSSIICSGAIVGRFVLNDRVTIRTAISMGLMIASIVFLSKAAASRSSAESVEAQSVTEGVLLSVFSGLCYGITGVYIRKAVRSQMPVCATLFIFSAAGFLVLCPLSFTLLPWSDVTAMTGEEWIIMSIAGWFNAIGFYAITHAMRKLTISRANVINASQNAFCAVGAVLVFQEQLNPIALVGIALTITGLLSLDRR